MNQIYVKIPVGIFDNRSAIYRGYHESDLCEDPGRDILIIDRRFIAGIMNQIYVKIPVGIFDNRSAIYCRYHES